MELDQALQKLLRDNDKRRTETDAAKEKIYVQCQAIAEQLVQNVCAGIGQSVQTSNKNLEESQQLVKSLHSTIKQLSDECHTQKVMYNKFFDEIQGLENIDSWTRKVSGDLHTTVDRLEYIAEQLTNEVS